MTENRRKVLLTAVSWEERFLAGLARLLATEKLQKVILLRYRRDSAKTDESQELAAKMCEENECEVEPVELGYSRPIESWNAIHTVTDEIRAIGSEVMLDISTMPREAIWTTLYLLQEGGVQGRYAYHMPASYGAWLSRDPGPPRLALKLSGQMRFGAPTVLCVLTGFDRERTNQLIRTFDPSVVLLGIQSGSQFGNDERNRSRHEESDWLEGEGYTVECFSVDAYATDHGFAEVVKRVGTHVEAANVLMASLGPKLSSIALFRAQRRFPSTGLVYTPSGEYNVDYSSSIGETVTGGLRL